MNAYRPFWLLTAIATVTLAAPSVQAQQLNSMMESPLIGWSNSARHAQGRRDLTVNAKLMHTAQAHAMHMASHQIMAHSLDGSTVMDRVIRQGYGFAVVGENVAYNAGYDSPVRQIFDDWMKSPPHLRNIMNEQFSEIGIGVAMSTKGRVYACMVFGRPGPMMPPPNYRIPYAPNTGNQYAPNPYGPYMGNPNVPRSPVRQTSEFGWLFQE